MNLLRLAAQILLIYLLYRLVVNFVIPTYRNISRFRKQFRSMQENMNQQFGQQKQQQQNFQQPQQNPQNEQEQKKKDSVAANEGEYIEFEEVKS